MSILVSLSMTVLIGIINAILWIFGSESFERVVILIPGIDVNITLLCTRGLINAVSLGFVTFLYYYINKHYSLIQHPLIDFAGILLGTGIMIGFYCIYRAYLMNFLNKIPLLFNNNSVNEIEKKKSML